MRSDRGKGCRGYAAVAAAAALVGLWAGQGIAQRAVPGEHKGVSVQTLGVVSEGSVSVQLGLDGHRLQLREITIAPGGQIARHSHEKRPGIVLLSDGAWLEGRPDGEVLYEAGGNSVIIEDEATVHWFWNDGSEPATAYVCDIVPAS